MSASEEPNTPDARYTYCHCKHKVPYLFIAPIDGQGHPNWNSASIERRAICWEVKCGFSDPWVPSGEEVRQWEDQYHSVRQREFGNAQNSRFDSVKVVGAGNSIGDTVISGTTIQNNSIVISLYPKEPRFLALYNNSAEISPKKQLRFLRKLAIRRRNRK
ncbi:hypothetical protein F5X98DRAFT_184459 [Xylaria grammica]|nr:hypothetical protein F5X98DRAFT_184459 [Xylaria grammica]